MPGRSEPRHPGIEGTDHITSERIPQGSPESSRITTAPISCRPRVERTVVIESSGVRSLFSGEDVSESEAARPQRGMRQGRPAERAGKRAGKVW